MWPLAALLALSSRTCIASRSAVCMRYIISTFITHTDSLTSAGTYTDTCKRTPGCTTIKDGGDSYCKASFLAKLNSTAEAAWYEKYRAFDSAVVGTCEAACYLKQIFSCQAGSQTSNTTLQSERALCEAKGGYCRWATYGSGTTSSAYCNQNMLGNDAWGRAVTEAYNACSLLSTNTTTCAAGPVTSSIQMTRIQTLLDYAPRNGIKC